MGSVDLVQLDAMERALDEARTLDVVLDMADKAAALQAYARRARLGLEAQNQAAAWKLRAERRAGEMLAESGVGRGVKSVTLTDLGIEANESRRWQRIARIPRDEFDAFVTSATPDGRELTQASALRLAPPPAPRPRRRRVLSRAATLTIRECEIDITPEDDAACPSVGAILHVTGVVRVTRVRETSAGTEIAASPVEMFVEKWIDIA